ncbi:Tn3 transposase DDE domain-containing protein [Novosphingobium panipatense]|uniref:Tn3 transposase DDE domain-containing protein n=1 Tax=Novosphingobium panipatense TaxID=428991 RepID=A0ABY1QXW4_9SPHN|nr:Tn3 transposase DDE domain-containing protein [Novosphingobium panipatense]
MPFFGYRFAPRLRDLKDRRLHLLPGQEAGPLLAGMAGDPVAIGHVAAHWDELLRLTTSIRSGTATASAMLRRLSAYPRQNGLALALREVGRIERSIFMLDWLRDLDLRRRTQAGLNKGEARNALARALFFNQLGELRDRRFEDQTYRASGLNLLVAAIILWNTRYLEQAVGALAIPDDVARHIAPLGWEHISPAIIAGMSKAAPIPASFVRSARRRRSWPHDSPSVRQRFSLSVRKTHFRVVTPYRPPAAHSR